MLPDLVCPNCGAGITEEHHIPEGRAKCSACGEVFMLPVAGVGPGTEIGGFRIERLIGMGGMGQVFQATQLSMDRSIALKLLPPAMTTKPTVLKRFMQEVRMSAKLEHPNIVTALAAGEDKGFHYLAMSYFDGTDLQTVVGQQGPLTEQVALVIARKVAGALQYAWDKHRLLHRDIKPANIMIDPMTNVKLMDMGISKSMLESSDVTSSGGFVGTPYYMSPEQANAQSKTDFRSDMYSLGATLYHLVTGVRPYEGDNPVAVLAKHMSEPLTPPQHHNPDVSTECATLLNRLMAKKPDERFGDWGELLEDINVVMDTHLRQREATSTPETRAVAEEGNYSGTETMSFRLDRSALRGDMEKASAKAHMESVFLATSPSHMTHFKARVLIVDDDPRMVRLMEASLPKEYVVRSLNSSFQALQCLDSFQPDIILLDINMPGLSGMEFLEVIRKNQRCEFTRVIIISGEYDTERRIEAYRNGADDFMAKPFSFEELKLKVQRWARFTRFEELSQLKDKFMDLISDDTVSPFPAMAHATFQMKELPELMEREEIGEFILAMERTSEDFIKRYHLLREYIECRCETYPLKIRSIDVESLMEPFLPLWDRQCTDSGVALECHEIPDSRPVLGDLRSLRRIMRWVFGNAVQYANSIVRVGYGSIGDGDFNLDIIDDGDGIDPELLPLLFNGFRAENELLIHRGIGLHLSLARELLRLQGGSINVVGSNSGRTHVQIIIPTTD